MDEKIKNYIKSFFEGLEIDIKNLEIVNEDGNFYFVKIESDDSALLIGTHGKMIENLQNILRTCVSNISGEKIKLKLEVNDYCKTYDDRLFARVEHSVSLIRDNGGEYDLGNLSAYDRKKVHSYVAKNFSDILSKSRGEGKNRRIFLMINKNIKKKIVNKLTIDIDGDDI